MCDPRFSCGPEFHEHEEHPDFWRFGHHRHGHCHPCCTGFFWPGPFFSRRFLTKEEKLARFEKYLEALKNEVKAVEEEIERLRQS